MLDHNKYKLHGINYVAYIQVSVLEYIGDFNFFFFICGSDFGILVNVGKQGWKHGCKIVNLFTIRNSVTPLESTRTGKRRVWYEITSQFGGTVYGE